MQSLLQRKLEAIWYDNKPGALLLAPLETLFCWLAQRRRIKQQTQQEPLDIPVIIVGNISIGGTGKTPLVIHLVELLQADGLKPAIITRGYKGESQQWPLSVDSNTDVKQCGDEAKLMALRSGVPVIAGPDRVADVRYILDNQDCNVIVSDDGLQHYRLKRDLEIVVVDGKRRFGNRRCLPAGPLREKTSRLKECDFVVVNGTSKHPEEHSMQVAGSTLVNLANQQTIPLSQFKNIQLATGIGNPERFVQTLESANLIIKRQYLFPDHHAFKVEDFNAIDPSIPLVMTEKDAVKCAEFNLHNAWYLPVNAQLDSRFEKTFIQRLSALK